MNRFLAEWHSMSLREKVEETIKMTAVLVFALFAITTVLM